MSNKITDAQGLHVSPPFGKHVLPAVFRILNLCSGIGGNSHLWEDCDVTAVENEPKIADVHQKLNPSHKVIVGDAYEYLKQH